MPRGGKRPGSGRKKERSKELVLTREIVEEKVERMAASAVDPNDEVQAIEVLRTTMMFFHKVGHAMLRKCEETAREGAESVPLAIDFLEEAGRMHERAAKVASELAPYQTPRLSATVPAGPEMKDITPDGQRMMNEGGRLNHIKARFAKGLTIVEGGKG